MTNRRRPDADDEHDKHGQPHRGCGDAGTEFTPEDVPVGGDDLRPAGSRSAPAPGVPVSATEYDRLKERARTSRARSEAPAQEDAPAKPTDE
jgi:hypothetical protein